MAKKRDRRNRKRRMKVINWHAQIMNKSIPMMDYYKGNHIGLRMRSNAPYHHLYIKNFTG